MILTYAGFPALFLSTRITPFEAVAVPKTDLIKLFPFHRFGSIYLDYTKCNFTYCEVTDGASSTSGNKPTRRKRGWRAGKNERRRTGCAISVLTTNRDNCDSPKQAFERNLVKIKISRTSKILSLKRFDQTPCASSRTACLFLSQ